jgi:hypothetical protein
MEKILQKAFDLELLIVPPCLFVPASVKPLCHTFLVGPGMMGEDEVVRRFQFQNNWAEGCDNISRYESIARAIMVRELTFSSFCGGWYCQRHT